MADSGRSSQAGLTSDQPGVRPIRSRLSLSTRHWILTLLIAAMSPAAHAGVVVGSLLSNEILVYNDDGTFAQTLVPAGSGNLQNPQDMVVAPTGNLLDARPCLNQIFEYSLCP